jgi:hypothetical protein
VSRFPAVSVLWWFADYFSVLQCHLALGVSHWLSRWVLWTATLLCFRQQLITCSLSALLPFQSLFTETQRSAPCSSPLLWCTYSTQTSLLHVSFQFLIYSVFFFFFVGQGVVLPRGLCWFIPVVAGGILHDAWCSSVGLLNVSQVGLEPASGSMGALLFSQYNVAWRSFIWARSFDSFWCFISAKCGFSISVLSASVP